MILFAPTERDESLTGAPPCSRSCVFAWYPLLFQGWWVIWWSRFGEIRMEDEAVGFFRHFQTIPSGILTFLARYPNFLFLLLVWSVLVAENSIYISGCYINIHQHDWKDAESTLACFGSFGDWIQFVGMLVVWRAPFFRVCIPNFKHVTPIGNDMDM